MKNVSIKLNPRTLSKKELSEMENSSPGDKLRFYLKLARYSQREFAQIIDTTPNNLNVLIKGKSTPSLRLAYEIEKNTGGLITMKDWLQGTNEVSDDSDTEKYI